MPAREMEKRGRVGKAALAAGMTVMLSLAASGARAQPTESQLREIADSLAARSARGELKAGGWGEIGIDFIWAHPNSGTLRISLKPFHIWKKIERKSAPEIIYDEVPTQAREKYIAILRYHIDGLLAKMNGPPLHIIGAEAHPGSIEEGLWFYEKGGAKGTDVLKREAATIRLGHGRSFVYENQWRPPPGWRLFSPRSRKTVPRTGKR